MTTPKQESHLFDPKKHTRTKNCKKMKTLIKAIGGKKGLVLAEAILKPKYLE